MASDHTASWELLPAIGDVAGYGSDALQDIKSTMRVRLTKEHYYDLTEVSPQPQQGRLRPGAGRTYEQETAPTQTPDGSTTLGALDTGRLWRKTSTGELFIWIASAWIALRAAEVVKALWVAASAPTNPAPAEGLMWFDTTNNVLNVYTSGAWKRISSTIMLAAPASPVNGDMWVA